MNLAAVSVLASHSVEALGEAAFLNKRLFKAGELAVQETARYRDQGQRAISGDLGECGRRGLCGLDGPGLSTLSMLSIAHVPRPLGHGVSSSRPPRY